MMLQIKQLLAGEILGGVKTVSPEGAAALTETDILNLLEYPPDPAMGDIALPCFKLSRILRRSPAQIANALAPCIGGDCVAGMTARLGAIVAGKPRALFLMAGVNDLIFSKITPEALLGQYERLLDAIRAASPRTTVFIQSLLPLDEVQNEEYFAGKNARIEAFNTLLRDMARRRGLDYIDIRSRMVRDGKMPAEYTVDGIHLNAAGYAVWVDVLRPYLP